MVFVLENFSDLWGLAVAMMEDDLLAALEGAT